MASMMITSGTMTNRIDRLAEAGFVRRTADPKDGRRAVVALTDKGFALIDKAVADHVKTQAKLMAHLSKAEIDQLDHLLAKLLHDAVPEDFQ